VKKITTTGWALRGDFNPLSPPQVMAYMKDKGFKIPTNRATGQPTTNDEGLNHVLMYDAKAESDLVLPMVLDLRRLRKGLGYLSDSYVGKDERFHPLYTFIPKTGRLSAKAPNIMNQPQGRGSDIEKEIARAIRETFIPFPGEELMEFDWKAIEALLVGFFAMDPTYIRASKLDIHSALGAHILQAEERLPREMFSWDWDDERLVDYFQWFKKGFPADRDRAKKKNHAGNYGQGVRNLAKDLGCTVKEAKALQEITDIAWPKVKEWRQKTRLQAHYEGKLMNPFGYPMSFFEVFTHRDGEWKPGKEANECLAFLPQSTAAAMLREALLDLIDAEEEVGFKVLAPIHDSILLSSPPEKREEVKTLVKKVMERPWRELGGLMVEVEGKVGPDLSRMEVMK
jgi:DNA polymerase I-like protein with 3'-5' exonuclease and polymerase domains